MKPAINNSMNIIDNIAKRAVAIKLELGVVVASVLLLSSCSVSIDDYQHSSPRFDIKSYFTGKVVARGMLQDYRSRVTRRFCVDINANWQGNEGLLAETFYFDDGEVSYRNWQLTKLDHGYYQGSAEDVVGTATGKQQGFAFHWQYQLQVPIDGQPMTFSLDDWMYQLDDYRVVNRTNMYKLGIKVAEITLFFEKQQSATALGCER